MKKVLSFILVMATCLTVLLSLASCGNKFSNLQIIDIGQEEEYYGIAFRKGSDMTRKVEDITKQLLADGTLKAIGQKYGTAPVDADAYIPAAETNADSGDWAYIQGKGKLVIGITDFKPMDYKDDNGKWIGFDAEYAEKVCEKLGVTAEFKAIVWEQKEVLLESKQIDCVWNGMTITDAMKNAASCTVPYMQNKQVAVVLKSKADTYNSLDAMASARITAEDGSAGAGVAQDSLKNAQFKAVEAQTDALLAVLGGQADVAIIDYIMAKALISK